MTYIIKPFYKDPSTYESRDDLIDYVNHLKSEMFNLIEAYNKLDKEYTDLLDDYNRKMKKLKAILCDD